MRARTGRSRTRRGRTACRRSQGRPQGGSPALACRGMQGGRCHLTSNPGPASRPAAPGTCLLGRCRSRVRMEEMHACPLPWQPRPERGRAGFGALPHGWKVGWLASECISTGAAAAAAAPSPAQPSQDASQPVSTRPLPCPRGLPNLTGQAGCGWRQTKRSGRATHGRPTGQADEGRAAASSRRQPTSDPGAYSPSASS